MEQLLTVKKAAALLGVSEDHLRALIDEGEIPYINIARDKKRRRIRLEVQEIRAFKERRRGQDKCLSIRAPSHHTTSSISSLNGVGFMAQRNARLVEKQKRSKA